MVSERLNYSNANDEEERNVVFSHLALPELPTLHDDQDIPPLPVLSLLTPRVDYPQLNRMLFGFEPFDTTMPRMNHPVSDGDSSYYYEEEQQDVEASMGECVGVFAWNDNSTNPYLVRHCREILSSFAMEQNEQPMNHIDSMENFLQEVIDICNDANNEASSGYVASSLEEEEGRGSSVWKLQ